MKLLTLLACTALEIQNLRCQDECQMRWRKDDGFWNQKTETCDCIEKHRKRTKITPVLDHGSNDPPARPPPPWMEEP